MRSSKALLSAPQAVAEPAELAFEVGGLGVCLGYNLFLWLWAQECFSSPHSPAVLPPTTRYLSGHLILSSYQFHEQHGKEGFLFFFLNVCVSFACM